MNAINRSTAALVADMKRPMQFLFRPLMMGATVAVAIGAAAAWAGDYDKDIWDALKIINEKAGETGMLDADRRKINDLFQAYGNERAKLMEEMLNLLARRDSAEIRDAWIQKSNKGRDLLDRLNNEIPKLRNGEGLAGAGVASFATGEKKIWDLNARANIPQMAEILTKISLSDIALIKKCEDDLKVVRDGDKAIEAQLALSRNDIRSGLVNLVLEIGKWVATENSTDILKGPAKSVAKTYVSAGMKNVENNLRLAKEKQSVKRVIADDINFIDKTRERLSPEWIEEVYKKGVEFAKDLPSTGASGDYRAADWDNFQKLASDSLKERRNESLENSKRVFNDLLPVFKTELTTKFVTFIDDPAELARWKNSVDEQFKTIDDLFRKQEEYNNARTSGAYMAAVGESLRDLRDTLKNYWDLFRSRTKDAEDEMTK
jgi:hypothetical protein